MSLQGKRLDLTAGIGLVVSNMIGAGVFVSAGFMAQDMGPGAVLLAWLVGAVLAMAGARAYATVARLVPRSGGEYRYLTELWHPFLGYLAGWGSLTLGFSAPIAISGLSAGAFLKILGLDVDPRISASVLLLVLTGIHCTTLRSSKWTQNLLVLVNLALVVGFILLGLVAGKHSWPTWTPPNPAAGFPWGAFIGSLFWIAFAFSGWNAAVYSAEEFDRPEHTVPRAMVIGCALVAVLYLLVNWVFVANLTPAEASVVMGFETQRITLAHVVTKNLVGEGGARVISVLAVAAFISSVSAMTFSGPRLYAVMARDGFLPRFLRGREGKPPVGSVLLQGILALALVWTQKLQQVLSSIGALLVVFSALTVLGLFRAGWIPALKDQRRPRCSALVAAGLYVCSAGLMLYFGRKDLTKFAIWIVATVSIAFGAFVVSRKIHSPDDSEA